MSDCKMCIDEEMNTKQVKIVCIHDPSSEKIKLLASYSNEDIDIQMSFCIPVFFCPICGKTESKKDIEDC